MTNDQKLSNWSREGSQFFKESKKIGCIFLAFEYVFSNLARKFIKNVQGVSKKRYFLGFRLISGLEVVFYFLFWNHF